ncbi:MAG: hypothetical protein KGM17_02435 [Sphingomonadales bacterium]|nr:hypothetical protein [Sphingomonadales bacterium]
MRKLLALLACALPVPAAAAETGALVRYVACPIYRDADSGKKSGCWLADDAATGQRWDVSLSPYKPDWNYGVLVEGRTTAAPPDACGAPVLEPVRTSRLYDMPCTRHMLPAEGYPGRRYKLQGRYIDPLSVARPVPPGPYAERAFPIYFEFGNDFLVYQYDDYLLDRAVTWIRAAKPKRLVVTGFAASRPETISGQVIAEPTELARKRAQTIAESLRRLLPGIAIETRWEESAPPADEPDADGIPGQSQRRVEIRALF